MLVAMPARYFHLSLPNGAQAKCLCHFSLTTTDELPKLSACSFSVASLGATVKVLGDRLMVGPQTLDLCIGVRLPVSQPNLFRQSLTTCIR